MPVHPAENRTSGGDFAPGNDIYVRDTVSFYADGAVLPFATGPVVRGVAQYTVLNPHLGIHTIVAIYNGGTDYVDRWVNDASSSGFLLQETDLPLLPPQPTPQPQPQPQPQPVSVPVHHHHHAGHHQAKSHHKADSQPAVHGMA
jgi:hypothetical protein